MKSKMNLKVWVCNMCLLKFLAWVFGGNRKNQDDEMDDLEFDEMMDYWDELDEEDLDKD